MEELNEKINQLSDYDKKWLFRQAKHRDLFNEIKDATDFLPEKASLHRRLYHIENNIIEIPKCKTCNKNPRRWRGRDGVYYSQFCSPKCLRNNPETKANYKKAMMEKYGCENPFQAKEVKEKRVATIMDRYGVSSPIADKDICKKMRESTLKTLAKEGINNVSQREGFKEKTQETWANKTEEELTITNNKKIKTCLEKYGVEHVTQVEKHKEKIKNTFLERYGVSHPSQNVKVFKKMQESLYKSKDYVLPSGKIVQIQGYENKCLDELFTKGYKESDIVIDDEKIENEVGIFQYVTPDGIVHRYFPDLYIKSENKIIEVKSTYTIKCNTDINPLKKKSVEDRNILFEYKIY